MKKCALIVAIVLTQTASAGVVITGQNVGNDVVFSGGGTLDLSLWTLGTPGSITHLVIPDRLVSVGPGAAVDFYGSPVNFSGPAVIGPGTLPVIADAGSSDTFGINWVDLLLVVPTNYVSGDQLDGSATWFNTSITSLGLTPGTYTWTWDTATGSDSFTVNIVPAPGALSLMACAGFVSINRRRRCDAPVASP